MLVFMRLLEELGIDSVPLTSGRLLHTALAKVILSVGPDFF